MTGRKIDPGSFHRKFKELEELRKVVVQDGKVTTPPAEAGGFSVQLCGDPLAWRPKADSPA